jgi:adenine deaminase
MIMVSQSPFRLADSRPLVDVAMGRKAADIVLRNGTWVCVQSGELIAHIDVAICGERIAYVGKDASHTIGETTQVLDASDRYLVPGLLDGHVHIESGMLTVTEFVRAVLPHGTTGLFVDPHEIGNVFGLKGVRMMVDEAALQPIHVFVQVPSCVPSAPGLETSGAVIGPDEVAEALQWDGIFGLGEVMNYPGVIMGDEKMHRELSATRSAGKVIGGHYASPDLGLPFHGYVAGGAHDDHEATRKEDAVERVRQGMRVMMRYGSAWQDVAGLVRAVTEDGLDARQFILCADDAHSHTLFYEGHMDRIIRHAISRGLTPMKAIQMATINTAEHFGLSRDVGMIAPGRYADILIVDDLVQFNIDTVLARGNLACQGGQVVVKLPVVEYPAWALHSVHLPHKMEASEFLLSCQNRQTVKAHVIGIVENQAPTQHLVMEIQAQDGQVHADIQNNLAKVTVIERHHGTGRVQTGLVYGFDLKYPCAIASTVAHDCHQLIVVGTDDTLMAQAANFLAESGGGQVVIRQGKVVGKVLLPVGGIMSYENAEKVAQDAASVLNGFRVCGCELNNPNMQLSLLALVVIPDLRISDMGLVDVNRFTFTPIFEE